MSWLLALVLFLVSGGVCYGLCWIARWTAPRVGLVDNPGGRKAHRAPTALGGGVAIWGTVVLVLGVGAFLVVSGQMLPPGIEEHRSGLASKGGQLAVIIGLSSLVMIMGLVDDRYRLDWKPRLLVQLGLAVGLVLTGARITLFGYLAWPPIGWILTVLWVVGLTNSFNFLDNMDGLAGGVGLIVALLFLGAQAAVGSLFVPAVLLVLGGSLAGFLAHNWFPARLFMGDAGSNFLGYLLGSLTVVGTFTQTGAGSVYSPFGALAPLLVMAVPLYDTGSVILIRIREGRSPFQADRSHFSHRLVERGLSPPWAVRTIYLVTLAGGLGALLLHRLDGQGALIVGMQTLSVLGVVAILEMSSTRKSAPNDQPSAPADAP